MTILPILIFLAPALLGTTLIVAWRLVPEKIASILVGATAGLAIFTTAIYVITLLVPLTASLLWILCLGLLAGAALAVPIAWPHWKKLPLDRIAAVILIILAVIFANIAPKLLLEKPDGLYTGIINAYGDVAWHMANITTFAEGQTTPPENPIFSDTRLTYPFMINFFSALLLVAKASLPQTVTLPALILIPVLLTLLYSLTHVLTNNKKAAVIAMLLFLLGGATFGWTRIISDWQKSPESIITFITHLPNLDYSGVGVDPNGFHFLNPVTSLLLPQRSLLIGFPLAFSLILILAHARRTATSSVPYLMAGVLAGSIPLFHAHTTLALVPVILGFFIQDLLEKTKTRSQTMRHWGIFALAACGIGLPEVAYYFRGTSTEGGSFLRWGPRWQAGEMNIVWYWFLNTGLLIPITIIGFFTRAPRETKIMAAAGLLLFLVANLWLFAPWAWDNFKLFVYFLLFTLPLVSLTIAQYLTKKTPRLASVIIVLLLSLHMLSASLDIWKISLPTAAAWNEWQTDEVAFAEKIKAATKPGESVVTAPNHNSPVVLSGRPRYLGYAAHVWSHGLLPWTREKALKEFYEGRLTILPETQPDYIFIGRAETATYQQLVIQPTWQLVLQDGPMSLYRLPKP